MKKTIKKLLFTLLLGISLLNAGTTSYSAATMEYTEMYDVELHAFDEGEETDDDFRLKY